jgi:polyvinyl alcohol dehydrogenase (cytochrome)
VHEELSMMKSSATFIVLTFVLISSRAVFAADSGEVVYQKRCAMCHDQGGERIPSKATLQTLPASRIQRALDAGAMMAVGFTLNRDDRQAVASYLGTTASPEVPSPAAFCADRTVKIADTPQQSWNGWSPTATNARFQDAAAARLSIDQVRRLQVKWAFGFDGDATAFAPPTVIDGEVFVGSAAGMIRAMHAGTGCLHWVFQANGPVRSSIVEVSSGRDHVLLFGDLTGWFYSIKAETGDLLWKVQVDAHQSTRLSGGPLAADGVVYVPVASWEEVRSADTTYACCTFRGSVVALRINDGKQIWKTWMTGPPIARGSTANGVKTFGPSGVGVWARPTLDATRNLLYIATGDNYSYPSTETSDAVLALDRTTGRIVWSKQLVTNDVYNSGCLPNPERCGPDFDFGSSPILVRTNAGRELLLAGQKSGVVWALDPANKGEVVWQARVGLGGTNGGVQWGMATDGEQVFATVSDLDRTAGRVDIDARRLPDPTAGGGLTALRVADGIQAWRVAAAPCAKDAPVGCSPAQPGAVTEIPGVVFATSDDGHVRAHATATGELLWDFNTMREFATVNHVSAKGGSIDGPGVVVSNGMVFVTSGYPRNGGVAGNVLLAFSPQQE